MVRLRIELRGLAGGGVIWFVIADITQISFPRFSWGELTVIALVVLKQLGRDVFVCTNGKLEVEIQGTSTAE